MMQAVILAAGQGKRLQPLTLDIPKAMIPINGKPMLQILIEQLKQYNVKDIIIVVHHKKEKITEHFGDGSKFGVKIQYVEQKEMKGSADAVLCAEQLVKNNKFFVIACDSLFETDHLTRVLSHTSDGVLTVREVKDARRYGVILHDGKKITRIIEKPEVPPSNLANFSVYWLPKEIFTACRRIPPGAVGEYQIVDAVQYLINKGRTFEFETSKHIIDIGTHEQFEEAQILAKKLGL